MQEDMGTLIKNKYNSNLNSISDNKFLFGIIGSGNSYLQNLPFGNNAQYLVHFPSPFNFGMQLVVSQYGELAARMKNSGSWTTWTKYTKS